MAIENSLVVTEQKTVQFYDDEIIAVRTSSGEIYVPLRPICNLLGLQWSAARKRVLRDSVLADVVRQLSVSVTDTLRTRQRDMSCLPLDYLGGFLFGINDKRVKPELQERIIRYRKECFAVLSQAFSSGRLTVHEEIMSAASPAAQAYRIAMALADMARHQWQMEQRLVSAETHLTSNTQRIETLESKLADPARTINDAQAAQVSQAVKLLGLELGKRSGRNEYGGIYGELYRRFSITSYKLLPAAKYTEAMSFLRQWYESIVDNSDAPF